MSIPSFSGSGRPINAFDVQNAAASIKVDVPALRAVIDVESRTSGFDRKNRPIILFEPHIFYRELGAEDRSEAERLGLAYSRWGTKPYPKTQDGQYDRLARAAAINPEAAFRAISMGLGQVLGQNFSLVGCKSAREMFEEAKMSEAMQLGHMVKFIKSRGLDKPLRDHNWAVFAAGYNGKGQVQKYAGWLEARYEKWRKIYSKPRSEITKEDLRDAGSKIITQADKAKTAVATATVAGPAAGVALEAAKGMVEPVSQAVQTAQQAQTAWEWISENWDFVAVIGLTVLFLIACYFAWRYLNDVQEERVRNARDGLNVRI